jgi:hypothetical protein
LPIIVVGGATRGVGKTSLICALIAAFPQFSWTAVKVTSHHYGQREPVSEEIIEQSATQAEQGTDTSRYLAAGARRALLVTASTVGLPLVDIRAALGTDTNVIFESNTIINFLNPDLCLAIVGASPSDSKPSFELLMQKADALVSSTETGTERLNLLSSVPQFALTAPDRISAEMLAWLQLRLGIA